jgi:ferrous iron transport protein A
MLAIKHFAEMALWRRRFAARSRSTFQALRSVCVKLESHSHFGHDVRSAVSSLKEAPLHVTVTITAIDGTRSFRRRLMEMGLVPGTGVRVVNVAPLGDPLEIEVRASRLSIRKAEAALIVVRR